MKLNNFDSQRPGNITNRPNSSELSRILEDVLEGLHFRGTVFFRSQLSAPWGVTFDPDEFARIHIALSGDFFVRTGSDKTAVEVKESDIVVLPNNSMHWIADRPGRRLVTSHAVAKPCNLSVPLSKYSDKTHELLCARIRFDEQVTHPLMDTLPNIIHIPGVNPDSSIWRLVALINDEIDHSESLSTSVVDRLTEVLFLQILREFIARSETPEGFVAALQDPRLSRALYLIHQRMEEDWTLEKLAREVCMSRATFVRHFNDAVGVAPIKYLTRWRLLKAHDLIKHSNNSLEHIAEKVGFASAQTLTKSFRHYLGYTPSSIRQPLDDAQSYGNLVKLSVAGS
jgi:AraC-like DNA-binding protein